MGRMKREDLAGGIRECLQRLPASYAQHYGVVPPSVQPPEAMIAFTTHQLGISATDFADYGERVVVRHAGQLSIARSAERYRRSQRVLPKRT
ncbi:hypothetical protein SXCC_00261 [Gluconacetobacter sp. SXCC-1]|nr:hypothetical protein SXCC_00298 [Gluconacetobacter sp. SXCC-1]EGG79043.1 hypothetical protein SXCC_00286 [Gluconacetobacter sp. SXCC-1]EGG79059.1 hypothetical protein SXCC_00261 [Gluconacetobacter sp. SXCC-1]